MVPQLTGKLHDNILQDIGSILEETEIGGLRFESVYLSVKVQI